MLLLVVLLLVVLLLVVLLLLMHTRVMELRETHQRGRRRRSTRPNGIRLRAARPRTAELRGLYLLAMLRINQVLVLPLQMRRIDSLPGRPLLALPPLMRPLQLQTPPHKSF